MQQTKKIVFAIYASILCMTLGSGANAESDALEKIRERCGETISIGDTAALESHLGEGQAVAGSVPRIGCIAVLFKDAASGPYPFHHQSHVLRFQPTEDDEYFFTAKYGLSEPPGRDLLWFNQTPVTFQGASRSGAFNRNIQRWEFGPEGFALQQEQPLSVRRVYADSKKGAHDQTLRIVKSFPIEIDGEIVDRLHVVVDDWGRWRNPDDHELQWMIYSEYTNAAIRPRTTLYIKGFPGANHLRSLDSLIYLDTDGEVELSIPAASLKSFNDFLYDFDVRTY